MAWRFKFSHLVPTPPFLKEYLEDCMQVAPNNHEILGDSVAWGGSTIIYLLGQQLHFELFDFSYKVLNISEADTAGPGPSNKSPQGWEGLLEAMKKARMLNNHVFSMLKARCPLDDKQASIKFENTVSAFDTLPQK